MRPTVVGGVAQRLDRPRAAALRSGRGFDRASDPVRALAERPSRPAPGLRRQLAARAAAGGDGPGGGGEGLRGDHVTEVIEAAGVSRATFYELFDDKEACFLEAYDAVIDVARRPRLGRLRGGRRGALAAADRGGPAGPGRAARRRGRHRPDGDGRGDRRRRERARATARRWRASPPSSRRAASYAGGRTSCPPTRPASRSAAPPR